jgi:putative oxidoreductase
MNMSNTILLRLVVVIILLMHGVPGMFDNGINDFGKLYLNEVGFAPFGVPLAWAIKLSHVVCAFCFMFNRYVKPAAIITIIILIAGIIMVHFKEGWYVVGGGRNGVEFNVLLIFVLLTIMFPNGFKKGQPLA